MSRYVLIYNINDFPDNGGGIQVEFFDSSEEETMHNRVNSLVNKDDRIKIISAGYLQIEYEYKPIEIVRKYLPEIKQ